MGKVLLIAALNWEVVKLASPATSFKNWNPTEVFFKTSFASKLAAILLNGLATDAHCVRFWKDALKSTDWLPTKAGFNPIVETENCEKWTSCAFKLKTNTKHNR